MVHIKNNQEIALDLSLIGAAAVGKSSLIDRYLNDEFKDYYDPTIAETYSKNAKWDNSDVKMNILDTAGMEDYRALSDNWIDGKDAVILVCSVEIHTSLEHLRSEYDNIKARFYDNPNFPTVVICLNKVDMDRQISFEEAKTFADELGLPLFETSAKTNVGI